MGVVVQAESPALLKINSVIAKASSCNDLAPSAALYSGGVTLQECVNGWFTATGKKKNSVAKKAGMKPSQISDIVSGRNPDPQFSTVERLARGFELSTTAFLRGPRPEEDPGHAESRLHRHLEEIERANVLDELYDNLVEKYPTTDETWRGDVQRAQAAVAEAAVALARALRRADEDSRSAPPDARKTGS